MTTTRKGANPYDKSSTPNSPNGDDSNKMAWIIGGGVVAVIAVIAIVVFAFSGGDDGGDAEVGTGADAASNATQETAAVSISGEDLPPLTESGLPAAGTDPTVGTPAPKVSGESFDGSEVVIDPSDGTPKLVVFLASWCGHCQEEVPVLQDWIDSGEAPEGLEIVSVSTRVDDTQPNYPPSSWLAKEGWTPKVLLDDDADSVAVSYGLSGTPYFVMIDADGNVWQRSSGRIPIEQLDVLADELVAGTSSTGGSGEGTEEQTPQSLPGLQESSG